MDRRNAYDMVEGGIEAGRAPGAVSVAIVTLILLNTAAVVLESYEDVAVKYSTWFEILELFSVAVFTIEYLARLWVAPENKAYKSLGQTKARVRYAISAPAIIDLLAILPAYLAMFLAVDLRILRTLRLLRLLKLTHYFSGLTLFFSVMRREASTLVYAISTITILILCAASLMYSAESAAQPDAFGSIPQALWWAAVTMTTVGYGDITPITPFGQALATVIMLLGVGIVALPAGMLAARFSEELQARKEKLQAEVELALQDGVLDGAEAQELDALREELGIYRERLDQILYLKSLRDELRTCPHCGNSIDRASGRPKA